MLGGELSRLRYPVIYGEYNAVWTTAESVRWGVDTGPNTAVSRIIFALLLFFSYFFCSGWVALDGISCVPVVPAKTDIMAEHNSTRIRKRNKRLCCEF
jgi:hypothetical protein